MRCKRCGYKTTRTIQASLSKQVTTIRCAWPDCDWSMIYAGRPWPPEVREDEDILAILALGLCTGNASLESR